MECNRQKRGQVHFSHPASQPTFDATDGYDGNGNLIASTDGLGVATEQTYDPLDRLIATLQDAGGADPATADTQTSYVYDARDNLRQVTDPDGLTTVGACQDSCRLISCS